MYKLILNKIAPLRTLTFLGFFIVLRHFLLPIKIGNKESLVLCSNEGYSRPEQNMYVTR